MNLLSIIKTKIFLFLKYFYFVEITSKPEQVIVQPAEASIFRKGVSQILFFALNHFESRHSLQRNQDKSGAFYLRIIRKSRSFYSLGRF